jgi:hypothetical protein
MTKFVGCVDQIFDEDYNLDIFNKLHPVVNQQRNQGIIDF